jgi:hypothetical protein
MSDPAHVAIIMDGNGRWAKSRKLPRLAGHRAGVEALRKCVLAASELGIDWLTVYAFSSENWSRPKSEVSDLMGLLKLFIRRDLAELHRNGVRVRVIGDRTGLQPDIKALLDEAGALAAFQRSVQIDPENAVKIVGALIEFGFELPELRPELFQREDQVVRMGVPPIRIEILTSISGVEFSECYTGRVEDLLDDVPVKIISLEHLKANKKASGRHQDLADLERLP